MLLGVIFLNAGMMMWLAGRISSNRNASRLAGEIIKSSFLLVVVAFILYVW